MGVGSGGCALILDFHSWYIVDKCLVELFFAIFLLLFFGLFCYFFGLFSIAPGGGLIVLFFGVFRYFSVFFSSLAHPRKFFCRRPCLRLTVKVVLPICEIFCNENLTCSTIIQKQKVFIPELPLNNSEIFLQIGKQPLDKKNCWCWLLVLKTTRLILSLN